MTRKVNYYAASNVQREWPALHSSICRKSWDEMPRIMAPMLDREQDFEVESAVIACSIWQWHRCRLRRAVAFIHHLMGSIFAMLSTSTCCRIRGPTYTLSYVYLHHMMC